MTQVHAEVESTNDAAGRDSVFLREITLTNLLSFGPETPPLVLGPLNVLVGANGSGKSNLIEAISLLRAAPTDLQAVTRQGGGVQEWIWKGAPDGSATINAVLAYSDGMPPLRHVIAFRTENQAFRLSLEGIETEDAHEHQPISPRYYLYHGSDHKIWVDGVRHTVKSANFNPNKSALAQIRESERYPALTYLTDTYSKIRIYREWQLGRTTIFRKPQATDLQNDMLEEDFSNLGMFLNRLRQNFEVRRKINDCLRDLLEGFEDLDFSIQGGTVQLFFREGGYNIPATRLSDGTLRYLCLLAILCDPTPPPLICLEEPELGLHPDLLPGIVDLLHDAAQRTQLIVTTHSDILIDALTETPEAVLVCEKQAGQTRIERLDREELSVWLDKYRLGELWIRGGIGGKRW